MKRNFLLFISLLALCSCKIVNGFNIQSSTLSDCGNCQESLENLEYEKHIIKYSYSSNKLYIEQFNAAFNCSPRLFISCKKEDNNIYINFQDFGNAKCLGTYNISYTIPRLKAGKYRVHVEDLHKGEQEESIVFAIDLTETETETGKVEFIRSGYPWNDNP